MGDQHSADCAQQLSGKVAGRFAPANSTFPSISQRHDGVEVGSADGTKRQDERDQTRARRERVRE